jgi:hypothetical protein
VASTGQLAQSFLLAAQQLGDRMLVELTTKDAVLADAVATAVANGERLVLSLVLGDEPVIELACVNDYGKSRRIASIPLRNPPPAAAH